MRNNLKKEDFNVLDIDIVVRKVTVMESVWTTERIMRLLKQIEKTEGFIGFKSIRFEVKEYPVIEYISELSEDK